MKKEQASIELQKHSFQGQIFKRVSDNSKHKVTGISIIEEISKLGNYEIYVSFIPKLDYNQPPIIEEIGLFLSRYKPTF